MGVTYLDQNNEVYQGHTMMAGGKTLPSDSDWVWDSGACESMTKDKTCFTDYTPLPKPVKYSGAAGDTLTAYGIGTVRIPMEYMDIFVKGVLYVPNVVANIVSTYGAALCGYRDELLPDLTRKITDSKGNLAGFAVPEGRIYIIHTRKPVLAVHDPLYRWHLRLGHLHYDAVSDLTKIPRKRRSHIPLCHACLAGKMTKQRNTEPQPRASRILELIHMDLGGYYEPSLTGF